ncbi:conserved Plasmodium protein, unknown function [Plasmodium vivax]|uniref:PI3K/PI4K catalytic domain-containing protein n=1 Tax=Plasmodium vivax TaxID=5855 RepID=A0A565A0C2_PLAVI|nr:conserved Plasmodium protein, unknown function [Plasmodium vivax]
MKNANQKRITILEHLAQVRSVVESLSQRDEARDAQYVKNTLCYFYFNHVLTYARINDESIEALQMNRLSLFLTATQKLKALTEAVLYLLKRNFLSYDATILGGNIIQLQRYEEENCILSDYLASGNKNNFPQFDQLKIKNEQMLPLLLLLSCSTYNKSENLQIVWTIIVYVVYTFLQKYNLPNENLQNGNIPYENLQSDGLYQYIHDRYQMDGDLLSVNKVTSMAVGFYLTLLNLGKNEFSRVISPQGKDTSEGRSNLPSETRFSITEREYLTYHRYKYKKINFLFETICQGLLLILQNQPCANYLTFLTLDLLALVAKYHPSFIQKYSKEVIDLFCTFFVNAKMFFFFKFKLDAIFYQNEELLTLQVYSPTVTSILQHMDERSDHAGDLCLMMLFLIHYIKLFLYEPMKVTPSFVLLIRSTLNCLNAFFSHFVKLWDFRTLLCGFFDRALREYIELYVLLVNAAIVAEQPLGEGFPKMNDEAEDRHDRDFLSRFVTEQIKKQPHIRRDDEGADDCEKKEGLKEAHTEDELEGAIRSILHGGQNSQDDHTEETHPRGSTYDEPLGGSERNELLTPQDGKPLNKGDANLLQNFSLVVVTCVHHVEDKKRAIEIVLSNFMKIKRERKKFAKFYFIMIILTFRSFLQDSYVKKRLFFIYTFAIRKLKNEEIKKYIYSEVIFYNYTILQLVDGIKYSSFLFRYMKSTHKHVDVFFFRKFLKDNQLKLHFCKFFKREVDYFFLLLNSCQMEEFTFPLLIFNIFIFYKISRKNILHTVSHEKTGAKRLFCYYNWANLVKLFLYLSPIWSDICPPRMHRKGPPSGENPTFQRGVLQLVGQLFRENHFADFFYNLFMDSYYFRKIRKTLFFFPVFFGTFDVELYFSLLRRVLERPSLLLCTLGEVPLEAGVHWKGKSIGVNDPKVRPKRGVQKVKKRVLIYSINDLLEEVPLRLLRRKYLQVFAHENEKLSLAKHHQKVKIDMAILSLLKGGALHKRAEKQQKRNISVNDFFVYFVLDKNAYVFRSLLSKSSIRSYKSVEFYKKCLSHFRANFEDIARCTRRSGAIQGEAKRDLLSLLEWLARNSGELSRGVLPHREGDDQDGVDDEEGGVISPHRIKNNRVEQPSERSERTRFDVYNVILLFVGYHLTLNLMRYKWLSRKETFLMLENLLQSFLNKLKEGNVVKEQRCLLKNVQYLLDIIYIVDSYLAKLTNRLCTVVRYERGHADYLGVHSVLHYEDEAALKKNDLDHFTSKNLAYFFGNYTHIYNSWKRLTVYKMIMSGDSFFYVNASVTVAIYEEVISTLLGALRRRVFQERGKKEAKRDSPQRHSQEQIRTSGEPPTHAQGVPQELLQIVDQFIHVIYMNHVLTFVSICAREATHVCSLFDFYEQAGELWAGILQIGAAERGENGKENKGKNGEENKGKNREEDRVKVIRAGNSAEEDNPQVCTQRERGERGGRRPIGKPPMLDALTTRMPFRAIDMNEIVALFLDFLKHKYINVVHYFEKNKKVLPLIGRCVYFPTDEETDVKEDQQGGVAKMRKHLSICNWHLFKGIIYVYMQSCIFVSNPKHIFNFLENVSSVEGDFLSGQVKNYLLSLYFMKRKDLNLCRLFARSVLFDVEEIEQPSDAEGALAEGATGSREVAQRSGEETTRNGEVRSTYALNPHDDLISLYFLNLSFCTDKKQWKKMSARLGLHICAYNNYTNQKNPFLSSLINCYEQNLSLVRLPLGGEHPNGGDITATKKGNPTYVRQPNGEEEQIPPFSSWITKNPLPIFRHVHKNRFILEQKQPEWMPPSQFWLNQFANCLKESSFHSYHFYRRCRLFSAYTNYTRKVENLILKKGIKCTKVKSSRGGRSVLKDGNYSTTCERVKAHRGKGLQGDYINRKNFLAFSLISSLVDRRKGRDDPFALYLLLRNHRDYKKHMHKYRFLFSPPNDGGSPSDNNHHHRAVPNEEANKSLFHSICKMRSSLTGGLPNRVFRFNFPQMNRNYKSYIVRMLTEGEMDDGCGVGSTWGNYRGGSLHRDGAIFVKRLYCEQLHEQLAMLNEMSTRRESYLRYAHWVGHCKGDLFLLKLFYELSSEGARAQEKGTAVHLEEGTDGDETVEANRPGVDIPHVMNLKMVRKIIIQFSNCKERFYSWDFIASCIRSKEQLSDKCVDTILKHLQFLQFVRTLFMYNSVDGMIHSFASTSFSHITAERSGDNSISVHNNLEEKNRLITLFRNLFFFYREKDILKGMIFAGNKSEVKDGGYFSPGEDPCSGSDTPRGENIMSDECCHTDDWSSEGQMENLELSLYDLIGAIPIPLYASAHRNLLSYFFEKGEDTIMKRTLFFLFLHLYRRIPQVISMQVAAFYKMCLYSKYEGGVKKSLFALMFGSGGASKYARAQGGDGGGESNNAYMTEKGCLHRLPLNHVGEKSTKSNETTSCSPPQSNHTSSEPPNQRMPNIQFFKHIEDSNFLLNLDFNNSMTCLLNTTELLFVRIFQAVLSYVESSLGGCSCSVELNCYMEEVDRQRRTYGGNHYDEVGGNTIEAVQGGDHNHSKHHSQSSQYPPSGAVQKPKVKNAWREKFLFLLIFINELTLFLNNESDEDGGSNPFVKHFFIHMHLMCDPWGIPSGAELYSKTVLQEELRRVYVLFADFYTFLYVDRKVRFPDGVEDGMKAHIKHMRKNCSEKVECPPFSESHLITLIKFLLNYNNLLKRMIHKNKNADAGNIRLQNFVTYACLASSPGGEEHRRGCIYMEEKKSPLLTSYSKIVNFGATSVYTVRINNKLLKSVTVVFADGGIHTYMVTHGEDVRVGRYVADMLDALAWGVSGQHGGGPSAAGCAVNSTTKGTLQGDPTRSPCAIPSSVVLPSVFLPSVVLPSVVLPSVVLPSVVLPSVFLPSVVLPSVVLPSVVPPLTLVPPSPLNITCLSNMVGMVARRKNAMSILALISHPDKKKFHEIFSQKMNHLVRRRLPEGGARLVPPTGDRKSPVHQRGTNKSEAVTETRVEEESTTHITHLMKEQPASQQRNTERERKKRQREVYLELKEDHQSETQKVKQYIHFLSSSNRDYFENRKTYTESLMLNSFINFILKVGDRNLINILYDYINHEIVNVDLGLSFQRGLYLMQPEIVPIRITDMFWNACIYSYAPSAFISQLYQVSSTWSEKYQSYYVNQFDQFFFSPFYHNRRGDYFDVLYTAYMFGVTRGEKCNRLGQTRCVIQRPEGLLMSLRAIAISFNRIYQYHTSLVSQLAGGYTPMSFSPHWKAISRGRRHAKRATRLINQQVYLSHWGRVKTSLRGRPHLMGDLIIICRLFHKNDHQSGIDQTGEELKEVHHEAPSVSSAPKGTIPRKEPKTVVLNEHDHQGRDLKGIDYPNGGVVTHLGGEEITKMDTPNCCVRRMFKETPVYYLIKLGRILGRGEPYGGDLSKVEKYTKRLLSMRGKMNAVRRVYRKKHHLPLKEFFTEVLQTLFGNPHLENKNEDVALAVQMLSGHFTLLDSCMRRDDKETYANCVHLLSFVFSSLHVDLKSLLRMYGTCCQKNTGQHFFAQKKFFFPMVGRTHLARVIMNVSSYVSAWKRNISWGYCSGGEPPRMGRHTPSAEEEKVSENTCSREEQLSQIKTHLMAINYHVQILKKAYNTVKKKYAHILKGIISYSALFIILYLKRESDMDMREKEKIFFLYCRGLKIKSDDVVYERLGDPRVEEEAYVCFQAFKFLYALKYVQNFLRANCYERCLALAQLLGRSEVGGKMGSKMGSRVKERLADQLADQLDDWGLPSAAPRSDQCEVHLARKQRACRTLHRLGRATKQTAACKATSKGVPKMIVKCGIYLPLSISRPKRKRHPWHTSQGGNASNYTDFIIYILRKNNMKREIIKQINHLHKYLNILCAGTPHVDTEKKKKFNAKQAYDKVTKMYQFYEINPYEREKITRDIYKNKKLYFYKPFYMSKHFLLDKNEVPFFANEHSDDAVDHNEKEKIEKFLKRLLTRRGHRTFCPKKRVTNWRAEITKWKSNKILISNYLWRKKSMKKLKPFEKFQGIHKIHHEIDPQKLQYNELNNFRYMTDLHTNNDVHHFNPRNYYDGDDSSDVLLAAKSVLSSFYFVRRDLARRSKRARRMARNRRHGHSPSAAYAHMLDKRGLFHRVFYVSRSAQYLSQLYPGWAPWL